ncbi:MAG TPA: hypothetical protein VLQ46_02080 [Casimicrobiaceae bacterium]|nr:hypothetical protein [Casimicrobiaceae bacterium]
MRAVSITGCGAATLRGAGSATIAGLTSGAGFAFSVGVALRFAFGGVGFTAGKATSRSERGVSENDVSPTAGPGAAVVVDSAGAVAMAGAREAVSSGASAVGWLRLSTIMIASSTTTKPTPAAVASHRMVGQRDALVRTGVTDCRGGVEAGTSGLIAGDTWLRSIGRVFRAAPNAAEAASERTAVVFADAFRTGELAFALVGLGANRD